MMMMKSVIWWRKPEYPEETTDLRQVTDEFLEMECATFIGQGNNTFISESSPTPIRFHFLLALLIVLHHWNVLARTYKGTYELPLQ